jgi:hypothetical protein
MSPPGAAVLSPPVAARETANAIVAQAGEVRQRDIRELALVLLRIPLVLPVRGAEARPQRTIY